MDINLSALRRPGNRRHKAVGIFIIGIICVTGLSVIVLLFFTFIGFQIVGQEQHGPMIAAIRSDNRSKVESLLKTDPRLIMEREFGGTALRIASSLGRREIVVQLLNHGVDIDERSGPADDTALSAAIMFHKIDVGALLLKNGANPNIADSSGRVPLHWAMFNYDPEAIRLLVASGANVNIRDSSGKLPIDMTNEQSPVAKRNEARALLAK
jgi:ankyrin repeat protein